jgi:DNA-directed RNA polymerase subunit omega
MKQPSIDELLQRVDSKYTLVVAAAKRARTITEDNPGGSANRLQKPVTQALFEIAEGKITYERTTEGIK